jgi:hypothetical protein
MLKNEAKVVIDEKIKPYICTITRKKGMGLLLFNRKKRFIFKSSHLNFTIKQELPYWVTSDKHFREVIEFIATELKN